MTGEKRGRGRPRSGPSDLRATELRVRLSPAELADVSELARLTGQTASRAVREAVTRALRAARTKAARVTPVTWDALDRAQPTE